MLKEVYINEKDTSLFEVEEGNKTGGSENIPVIRKKVVKTNHYIDNILAKSDGFCNILPRNCRFIQRSGKNNIIVMEEPPNIKSLRFDYNFNNELADIEKTGILNISLVKKMVKSIGTNVLKLAFPYVVFVMSIKEETNNWELISFRVFFKIHPIKRKNDYLYIANVLNLGERNELCFGGNVMMEKPQMQLVDAAESLVHEFWIRPFTYEYETRYKMYQKISILNNLLMWAYYTQKDPMFIYSSDWVLHNRSLEQEINAMLLETGGSSSNTIFNTFFVDTVQPGRIGQICFDTLKLTKKILSVGDQIKIGNEELYVYNFIGDRDGPTHVVFTDIEGKEIEPLKITEILKENWNKQLEQQLMNYVETIQIGSEVIKIGDIIKIISTNTYEIVNRIRISRDNMVELECNTRFYIAIEGNIKVIKSVDANGIELIPNKDYIVCSNQYQHGYTGKMIRVQSNNQNRLTVYFKDSITGNENNISMNSLEEEDITIFPSDDNKIQDIGTFRYMNRLYTNTSKRYLMIKNHGIYDRRGNEIETFYHEFDSGQLLCDIFNDDKTIMSIPGIDMDINFKVGDKVIIGDWDNPEEMMLKIREITGFEIRNNSILFKLHGESDNIMVKYIDLQHGVINVGYIRKAATEFNNVPIGTIVITNKDRIHNFPKKDRNKIAAFIIDGSEPLILFQSGLTIWFSDLEDNFDLLLPGTDPYKKIRKIKTLNCDDIKWQTGDLCINENKHYLFNNDNSYMGVVYMEIHPDFVKTGSLRSRAKVSSELDNSFKRFGIIDPRHLKKDSIVMYELIPNFHNGSYKVPFDGYYPYTIRRRTS